METKISSKGQVVLPKALRDKRRWKIGTRLTVEERVDGVLLKPVEKTKKLTIDDWAGIFRYKGPTRTIGEMDAAIVEEVRRRHARGRY
ncbi:MAG: AbrB/MazE/SpoVT family DNA-binding domain-containing protein [Reyranella sp.]|uniref:AbrB/MazE/SpoVT family DNA-binding domain-containing protein n=1 Tax=Reyranella sp. TaxID=1929291 RepID=UPI001AD1B2B2|nr:AbrB/MazE/SpoVT family DNA-binding domain-containing protein [Reyranella sp.]MBN9091292.1 AbrB/MazE/SpoVT family DNA-binding domain-containing protein [Reyranella sp.]